MQLSEALPFWKQLTEQEKQQMISTASKQRYHKGELVHHGGQKCTGLLIVTSGLLRVYTTSEEGKEITLYRLYEYDICLLSASCIFKNIMFEIMVEAEEETEVILIPPDIYAQIQKKNVAVSNYTNELIAAVMSDIMWLMNQVMFKKIDSRLAAFLIEESSRGQNPLMMTHEEISRHLGTAREVVSRMMKYFEKERLVELSRGSIKILDQLKLTEIAGDSLR